MINFTTLSMRNFLSYGNNVTQVNLDRTGTTMILGEDLDNTSNGEGANGVGKSSILNALVYAVYDKPVSNISKDNLVNNVNKKNMEVAVEFNVHGKTYRIVRTRKMKAGAAGNTVHLYEGEHDITLDSASATNKLIEQIIGINYELFCRIVVFSASHTPFLDLPVTSHYATNQKDIIEELFGLTSVSAKAQALKDVIKDTEIKIDSCKIRIEMLEKEKIRHQQQIIKAKERVDTWTTQTKDSIKKLKSKLKRVEEVDVEEQQKQHMLLSQEEDRLQISLNNQNTYEKQVRELSKDIKKNEAELEHLRDAKCPRCLQKYADAAKEIATAEQTSENLANALAQMYEKINAEKLVMRDVTRHIKTIKELIVVEDIEELLKIKSDSALIRQKLNDLQSAINPHLETLQELEETKLDEINYDEVNTLTKLVEHQKFLLKLLTKKDSFVRKALLNKNIPYLNGRLQHYLSILGLSHNVEFTHEMTARITQFGNDLDFGNLSAGQKARVNIALSFAFRDVLQSLHTKINVCMLDEVLDVGLDVVGVQAAARMLKRKARDEKISLYVISHREIDSAFDRVMTIQLSKGFSYIKEEVE